MLWPITLAADEPVPKYIWDFASKNMFGIAKETSDISFEEMENEDVISQVAKKILEQSERKEFEFEKASIIELHPVYYGDNKFNYFSCGSSGCDFPIFLKNKSGTFYIGDFPGEIENAIFENNFIKLESKFEGYFCIPINLDENSQKGLFNFKCNNKLPILNHIKINDGYYLAFRKHSRMGGQAAHKFLKADIETSVADRGEIIVECYVGRKQMAFTNDIGVTFWENNPTPLFTSLCEGSRGVFVGPFKTEKQLADVVFFLEGEVYQVFADKLICEKATCKYEGEIGRFE